MPITSITPFLYRKYGPNTKPPTYLGDEPLPSKAKAVIRPTPILGEEASPKKQNIQKWRQSAPYSSLPPLSQIILQLLLLVCITTPSARCWRRHWRPSPPKGKPPSLLSPLHLHPPYIRRTACTFSSVLEVLSVDIQQITIRHHCHHHHSCISC